MPDRTSSTGPRDTAPEITAQPSNQTVTAPAAATFAVTATGTTPLTYTWQSAPSGSASFTAIGGAANSASYTTPATSAGQSGTQFRVVVSNGVSPAATSSAATLTVNGPAGTAPSITAQPTNQTVSAGQTATFTVSAAGSAPLSYQWQSAPAGSSSYTNVGSASATASLAVANTTVGMSGSTYRVVVSNGVNPSATSSAATLTVNGNICRHGSVDHHAAHESDGYRLGQTGDVHQGGRDGHRAAELITWQSAPSGSSSLYDRDRSASATASLGVANTTATCDGQSGTRPTAWWSATA